MRRTASRATGRSIGPRCDGLSRRKERKQGEAAKTAREGLDDRPGPATLRGDLRLQRGGSDLEVFPARPRRLLYRVVPQARVIFRARRGRRFGGEGGIG